MRDWTIEEVVFLKDGEITDVDVKCPTRDIYADLFLSDGPFDRPVEIIPEGPISYMFEIKVISTGETFIRRQEFEALVKNDKLYLLWELRNGQIAALPFNKKARESLLN